VLVIMAVAGGLGLGLEKDGQVFTGADAFRHHYSSWAAFSGIDAKLEAFVIGASTLFKSFGIPPLIGKSILLGTDNQLHSCDDRCSVFFRPRSSGSDDEVFPEGGIDDAN